MKKEHTHARRVDALPADGCAVMVRAYFTAAGCMLAALALALLMAGMPCAAGLIAAPACAASFCFANISKGARPAGDGFLLAAVRLDDELTLETGKEKHHEQI